MIVRAIPELLLLSVLWGTAYLFTRAAVPEFGPLPMVALRFAIASCLLVPVMIVRGGLPALWENRWRFAMLGIVFTAVPFLVIGFAAQSLGAGLLAILNATAPLFAGAGSYGGRGLAALYSTDADREVDRPRGAGIAQQSFLRFDSFGDW